jgi:hypothetical protein
MPLQDVTAEAGKSGEVLFRIPDRKRVVWSRSGGAVLDREGAVIGFVFRHSGGVRMRYEIQDSAGRCLCTCAEDRGALKGLGREVMGHLLSGGYAGSAVAAGARVVYAIRTPDGRDLGSAVRNAAGHRTATIDLSGDPEFAIDRRLALALAMRITLAEKG